MKKISLLFLMSLLSLVSMAQGMNFEAEGTTLEQASVKAKAENKLIFLDCYTQWCGPCKQMAKKVFPTEEVGAYMNPKFINLKMDMETPYGSELAKKLQVQAFPTFVIFNADAKEIGRFLGSCTGAEFIAKVADKSKDDSGSSLSERWAQGDRDPEFLKEYLKTLTAAYKADDANSVAEALLEGKESTFASDAELRNIFMGNINNPFAKSFVYTVKNPDDLKAAIGEMPVNMKIQNVLQNYNRQLIKEENGSVALDQQKFDEFKALLTDMKIANADHYTLSTLITLSEKQKDFSAYIGYIKQYLANPNLDADDMQLARWVKPCSDPQASQEFKSEMKNILLARIADIKAGKRKAQNKIGNMTLSVPTDQFLTKLVDTLDGKMPTQ